MVEKSFNNDDTKLTEDDVIDMIQTVSLSTNQTIKILKIVRQKFPEYTLISPNIHQKLIQRNLIFKRFFTTKLGTFEDKDRKNITVPTTYCNDIPGFIEESSALEGYDYKSKQNVLGADVGLGAFACTLSQPDKKQSGTLKGKSKNMVKCTKVLVYARGVPESYHKKFCKLIF